MPPAPSDKPFPFPIAGSHDNPPQLEQRSRCTPPKTRWEAASKNPSTPGPVSVTVAKGAAGDEKPADPDHC